MTNNIEEAEVVRVEQEHPPAKDASVQQGPSQPHSGATPSGHRPGTIALSPDGLLAPTNHSEAWRIAEVFLESKAIPKQFQNVSQVFMALQFLRGIGFGAGTEVAALRQCTIINGTLSIWGDLPLALCRRSGKLEWIREQLFTDDYVEVCVANKNLDAPVAFARCVVKRVGEEFEVERVFHVHDAKRANLWGKSGPWASYPTRMLQMRARSWALKDACSDALSGISIAEYDHNALFDGTGAPLKITEPARGVAADLNREYLEVGDDGSQ